VNLRDKGGNSFERLFADIANAVMGGSPVPGSRVTAAQQAEAFNRNVENAAERAMEVTEAIAEQTTPYGGVKDVVAGVVSGDFGKAASGAANLVPVGKAITKSVELAAKGATTVLKNVGDVIHVTKSGVALPPGPKYQIPKDYVENPNRSGSYGVYINDKFTERLRIDPATPPNKKGPNYSHYHLDRRPEHHSPRQKDDDPGFE
jgi:hypothetical protein